MNCQLPLHVIAMWLNNWSSFIIHHSSFIIHHSSSFSFIIHHILFHYVFSSPFQQSGHNPKASKLLEMAQAICHDFVRSGADSQAHTRAYDTHKTVFIPTLLQTPSEQVNIANTLSKKVIAHFKTLTPQSYRPTGGKQTRLQPPLSTPQP